MAQGRPTIIDHPERGAKAIAARIPRTAGRVLVLTGAGMSTEAGLPDFRSNGGLWQNRRFEALASTEALEDDFEAFTEFYRWRLNMVLEHQPHAGHHVLAELLAARPSWGLATQNVDGYHEEAALPFGTHDGIWALHGQLRALRCQACRQPAEVATYLKPGGEWCSACGGKVRAGVVLFGESLPQQAVEGAWACAQGAELVVVLGSSLQVSPANQLPMVALAHGAELVIVNQGPTALDGRAALKVEAPIGPTLKALQQTLLDADEA